jgi:hypothetical protein
VARYVTHAGHARFLGGYTLGLFPPSTLKPDGLVSNTNNPGLMQRNLPWPVREGVLPKPDLRDIQDYDEKLERMAAAYLDHDVRAMSGTTCWFSVFFDKLLRAAAARGRRASTVSELWPNLEVLFGGGINAEPYRPVIEKRVGRPMVVMDNYNATEGGIFAVTDRIGEPGMLTLPRPGRLLRVRSRIGARQASRSPAPALGGGTGGGLLHRGEHLLGALRLPDR